MNPTLWTSRFGLAAARRSISTNQSNFLLLHTRPRLVSTLVLTQRLSKPVDPRWRGSRWNSTNSAATAAATTTETIPEAASTSIDALAESLAPTIGSVPPLQAGDLAALGLCHWTPAGMVQYSLEAVHLLTGLPWFWTFVATSVLWRFVVFPFSVNGARQTARMRPVQSQLNELVDKMKEARRVGDTVSMQRASMEMKKVRKDAGVSMLGAASGMLVQLPVSLGLFFGIKRMCELPVIQLTQSGFDWLPDLTQPSHYILPLLVTATGNAMFVLTARDMDNSNPSMGHILNAFRLLSVVGLYWLMTFPSGLTLSLFVTTLLTAGQIMALRNAAIRRVLRIPPLFTPPGGELVIPTFRESFRYFLNIGNSPSKQSFAKAASPKVAPYIPPKAMPTLQGPPRTLDELARQAQSTSRMTANSSGLFETEPIAAPRRKKTTKPKAKVSKK